MQWLTGTDRMNANTTIKADYGRSIPAAIHIDVMEEKTATDNEIERNWLKKKFADYPGLPLATYAAAYEKHKRLQQ